MTLRDEFVSIMNAEGAAEEGSWHSWRCFDRERYPEPCLCTETVAKKLVAAAMLHAVEAVLALPYETLEITSEIDDWIQISDAVDAIEGIGGER